MTQTGEGSPAAAPTPPASLRKVVFVTGVALLTGVGAALWLVSARPVRHPGYLNAVNEVVTAGRQARITKLLVKPGQVVSPGTALLTLQDASLESARVQQQQLIATLEAELHQVQARATVEIADRKAKLEAEIFETQLKLAGFEEKRFDQRLALFAAENRVMVAQAEERLSTVQIAAAGEWDLPFTPLTIADAGPKAGRKRDFLFELQERETTRNKLETSEAQVSLCEERLELLKKQLEHAPAQINEAFGVNVIQTKLQSAQESLAKLDAEAPQLTVTATKYGTVGLFEKTAGELTAARETIVELFDSEQPYVVAEIPSSDVYKFAAGTCVELTFPGGTLRSGVVSEIPPQAVSLPGSTERLSEQSGRVRLRITQKGRVWPQVPFGTYVEIALPSAVQSAPPISSGIPATTGTVHRG